MADAPATVSFSAALETMGTNATGIVVPPEAVEALGSGKKPKVTVHVGSYSYLSTVAVMGGRFLLPFAAEHRAATGLAGGDALDVRLVLDTSVRTVDVPDDLAKAMTTPVRATFDALSYSKQRAHVLSVEGAKTEETRQRRIAKVLADLTP